MNDLEVFDLIRENYHKVNKDYIQEQIRIATDYFEVKEMRVNILGTDYEIVKQTEKENPKLKEASGICEIYSKQIIIKDYNHADPEILNNIEVYDKETLRHEIIHAFFAESGLCSNSDYATNEELIDWIAIQFPKMLKVFQEVNAL